MDRVLVQVKPSCNGVMVFFVNYIDSSYLRASIMLNGFKCF